jgi:hypothetical protein
MSTHSEPWKLAAGLSVALALMAIAKPSGSATNLSVTAPEVASPAAVKSDRPVNDLGAPASLLEAALGEVRGPDPDAVTNRDAVD